MENLLIFEVFRSHFSKSELFCQMLDLTDVVRRFSDVTKLTWAFCNLVSTNKPILIACNVTRKMTSFFEKMAVTSQNDS